MIENEILGPDCIEKSVLLVDISLMGFVLEIETFLNNVVNKSNKQFDNISHETIILLQLRTEC